VSAFVPSGGRRRECLQAGATGLSACGPATTYELREPGDNVRQLLVPPWLATLYWYFQDI
jgi:hypothetical protein